MGVIKVYYAIKSMQTKHYTHVLCYKIHANKALYICTMPKMRANKASYTCTML